VVFGSPFFYLQITNSAVVTFFLGPHHITGNGVGFKPDILDMDIMEKVLEVRKFYFLLHRDLMGKFYIFIFLPSG